MTAVVKGVWSSGARLILASGRAVTRRRPLQWPIDESLPVCGLDDQAVHAVLFALEQCLGDDEVRILLGIAL